MPDSAPSTPTLAKIVATLGPASDSPEMIGRLIEAGVSIFRLNFSHGTPEEHKRRLDAVRQAAKDAGRRGIAVLGDLQGPKIRLGRVPPLEEGGLVLRAGDDVLIRATDEPGVRLAPDRVVLPTQYAGLATEVEPGHRVLINDGAIRMLAVERISERELRCQVLHGGVASSHKGINLPDSDVKAPAVTERDWEWVAWAVEHGLDFLALSFVRHAAEVRELRLRLAGMCSVHPEVEGRGAGSMIPVIAKIEKPQALAEIDAILDAADGIMVARGDLGVEMDLAEVPSVQKRLIAKADEWGKPSIVATQMLESMISSPVPTRAEVSDVANAVFDGADAVMLSGETAVGRYPVLAVEAMRRTIAAAERRLAELPAEPSPPARLVASRYRTAALAHGAWHAARDVGATIVACWSQRGGTARYLSQNGFRIPILAYSSDQRETRRMSILRGVTAEYAPELEGRSLAAWNRRVERDVLERGWAKPGDPIILLAGLPLGRHGATTTIAIHYIGNLATGYLTHE